MQYRQKGEWSIAIPLFSSFYDDIVELSHAFKNPPVLSEAKNEKKDS